MGNTHALRRRPAIALSAFAALALVAAALAVTATAASDNVYTATNVVSDETGVAPQRDTHLVNGWGLDALATSPWWVANNGTATASLYRANGTSPRAPVNVPGRPTGLIANPTTSFTVTNGTTTAAAVFIFSTEEGKIFGWNPGVAPNDAIDTHVANAPGAIYKGLAFASTANGNFLYATDFHNGHVDVFDGALQPATLPAGAFTDPSLPSDYAPFGIQRVGSMIVVTYAKQDSAAEDEVAGQGKGFVDAFDTSGALLRRIGQHGQLNAPWGIAQAPDQGFGRFSGDLLIGNFGDGEITAFAHEPDGAWAPNGQLRTGGGGKVLSIDGLWSLQFGHGSLANNGPTTTLFFTAGPNDEKHGLFGTITAG
jgi:uncharacterized protein (TIGR03118 family)